MKRETYLEVTLNVGKQRNIADTSDDEHQEGDGEDEHGEGRGHRKGRGDEVTVEVLRDIIPVALLLLGEIERIQSQRVDRLTRTVGEEKPLPALEGEEDEESKIIHSLCRVGNVTEETEVIIRPYEVSISASIDLCGRSMHVLSE